MTLKKIGMVLGGSVAALVAVAPFALAHGTENESTHPVPAQVCEAVAGDSSAVSAITGDSFGNIVAQVPVAGSNIADCNDILNGSLNGNLNGNLSNNTVNIGGAPAMRAPL